MAGYQIGLEAGGQTLREFAQQNSLLPLERLVDQSIEIWVTEDGKKPEKRVVMITALTEEMVGLYSQSDPLFDPVFFIPNFVKLVVPGALG